MPKDPRTLSLRLRTILLNLAYCLVPPGDDLEFEARKESTLHHCEQLVFELPLFMKWGFKITLRLFDRLPFLFGFGFTRFCKMDHDKQILYIDNWALSSLVIKREIFKAIKGVLMLVCFSDKKIWHMMNYHPDQHIEERLQMREELIKKASLL